MKKIITYLFILLFLSSCGAFKTTKESNTESNVSTNRTTKRDSSNVVEKNREISDRTTLPVTQSDDPKVNKKIDEILSKLNSSKTSGNSGYIISYDPELKQLLLELKVAATEDKTTKTNNQELFEERISTMVETYIKKIKIPTWWIILGLVIIFRKPIFGIILFFIPGLSNIRSVSDLFKK